MFKQLMESYTSKEIITRLIELYPDQEKSRRGYKNALRELRNKKIRKSTMQLFITEVEDDGEKWMDVAGCDMEDGTIYALTITSWSTYLGMEIHEETYKNVETSLDVVVHTLWEMTFNGYSDKQTGNFKRMLTGRVNSASKTLLEGKEVETPLDLNNGE